MKYLNDDEVKTLISKCECMGAGIKVEMPDWNDLSECLKELLDKRSIQADILELLDEPDQQTRPTI